MRADKLQNRRQLVYRIGDLAVVGGSMILAMLWRTGPVESLSLTFWWGLAMAMPLSAMAFQAAGAYDHLRQRHLARECSAVLIGIGLIAFCILAGAFAMKSSDAIPRLAAIAWAAMSAIGVLSIRLVFHAWVASAQKQGHGVDRLILAGDAAACRSWGAHLTTHGDPEARVVAMAIEGADPGLESVVPLEQLRELAQRVEADRVLVCSLDGAHLKQVTDSLADLPLTIQYAPTAPSEKSFLALRVSRLGGRGVIDVWANPLSDAQLVIKWIEDKVVAIIALIVASPVMIAAAIAVKVTSKGPVFYVQSRHGLNGQIIKVYKFRSMMTEGKSLDRLTGRFVQATKGDPRITPVGRFLRNSSIDELPQFFNVLAGDMSVVGPRPHAIRHNQQFQDAVVGLMRRHYVKPGITGLAQISGSRGETQSVESMRTRVNYDLEYIASWSLWLDLKIIVITVFKGFYNHHA